VSWLAGDVFVGDAGRHWLAVGLVVGGAEELARVGDDLDEPFLCTWLPTAAAPSCRSATGR
jgi:hypothetical protein